MTTPSPATLARLRTIIRLSCSATGAPEWTLYDRGRHPLTVATRQLIVTLARLHHRRRREQAMMEIRPACPYCKSIRISGNEWRIEGIPQQFWCRDCGHTWTYEALDDMRREALAAIGWAMVGHLSDSVGMIDVTEGVKDSGETDVSVYVGERRWVHGSTRFQALSAAVGAVEPTR